MTRVVGPEDGTLLDTRRVFDLAVTFLLKPDFPSAKYVCENISDQTIRKFADTFFFTKNILAISANLFVNFFH